MNHMKKPKDMTLKDELPSSVGTRYTTGEEQRNSSGRIWGAEPKRKQLLVWVCLAVKAESDAVKTMLIGVLGL